MKQCDRCNVEICDEIGYCPLCGRCLDDKSNVEQCFSCYPDNKKWVNKRSVTLKILFWSIIIATIVSCITELFFIHSIKYNSYVIAAALLLIVDIILPLKRRWSFCATSAVVGISICAFLLFIEIMTKSFGWGLIYAIPFFLLFMSLNCTIIIWARNYRGLEFIIPLIIFAIISTAIFSYNYVTKLLMWPSLVAFMTSITCFLVTMIFRFKKVKKEFEKSFFV